ncbi:hypothetical protein J2X31_000194 [Flavobacterium arsenatis]|uniref:BatC protein n=1 Tax=Flavobacterium arsenatis TaxID=1484332 RepID=A0ABU1TJU6_9FLAO|nr:hypothetical protein [Flavobacterium arsenatis]MDR6966201.1 hypothetical protein [Flavobacterium arsenatis]
MENKDLGAKKANNEQQLNEGFSGQNMPKDTPDLKNEVEKDKDGNADVVKRARNVDDNVEDSKDAGSETKTTNNENQNQKTVENKDKNSDITPNRYPNSHPENHEDRGNMKLDE